MKYTLFFIIITFAACSPSDTKPKTETTKLKTTLTLSKRLAQYPFSESAKVELVALAMSEFADIEEKKAQDSTNCSCKSVFGYSLKDVITKKIILNTAQIDSLTAILFQTDTAKCVKARV